MQRDKPKAKHDYAFSESKINVDRKHPDKHFLSQTYNIKVEELPMLDIRMTSYPSGAVTF